MTNEAFYRAVRTYQANNNANGGTVADPSAEDTFNDLFNQDYTTPGFITIPVCSAEMVGTAIANNVDPTTLNYPCVVPPSPNTCQVSSFTDATSNASPLVTDCQQIVANIQGTQGSWTVEAVTGKQHQLVQFGTCAFGVTADAGHGRTEIYVGAQDIVDLITSSISMFASNGKVGSSGTVDCNANIGTDTMVWGLYTNP
jgi:hypothetical protein